MKGLKVGSLQPTFWRRRIFSNNGAFGTPSALLQTIESQTAKLPPHQTKYGHKR